MKQKQKKERILILGGSGFIGLALYKELQSFYDVKATYYSQIGNFYDNNAFDQFDIESDSITDYLEKTQPTLIISALSSSISGLRICYSEICEYVKAASERKFMIFSSASVFDAKPFYPSYDNDLPLSSSRRGKAEIELEKALEEKIPIQHIIIRIPLVLGINSPIIVHLRQCIRHYATFEVFPNLVVSATTINKLRQQIHYIINRSLTGIFHLASNDMIHHDELFKEICQKISDKTPIFKNTYNSNEDRYSALLVKANRLPKTYQITISEVIEASSLNETITSGI